MAVLRAVSGPLKGAVFQLASEEVTVGRQASSQLCVGDPSVSRQHCVIQLEENGFRIRDLGSNHGTFVNGKRVEAHTLADRDKIRIGDTVFQFTDQEGEDSEPPALPDNSLVALSYIQRQASESAETAMLRLFEDAPRDGEFAARARSFLRIGAGLNIWQESRNAGGRTSEATSGGSAGRAGGSCAASAKRGRGARDHRLGSALLRTRFRGSQPHLGNPCHP